MSPNTKSTENKDIYHSAVSRGYVSGGGGGG